MKKNTINRFEYEVFWDQIIKGQSYYTIDYPFLLSKSLNCTETILVLIEISDPFNDYIVVNDREGPEVPERTGEFTHTFKIKPNLEKNRKWKKLEEPFPRS